MVCTLRVLPCKSFDNHKWQKLHIIGAVISSTPYQLQAVISTYEGQVQHQWTAVKTGIGPHDKQGLSKVSTMNKQHVLNSPQLAQQSKANTQKNGRLPFQLVTICLIDRSMPDINWRRNKRYPTITTQIWYNDHKKILQKNNAKE